MIYLLTASSDWRDLSWTSIPSVLPGIDDAVQTQRQTLFGKNEIDIEAKSTGALLVDEACCPSATFSSLSWHCAGHPSVLHFPNCKRYPVVSGWLLLLCILHCSHLCGKYCLDVGWNKAGVLSIWCQSRVIWHPLDDRSHERNVKDCLQTGCTARWYL